MAIAKFGIKYATTFRRLKYRHEKFQVDTFLPEAKFGLWVFSLPVCVCVSANYELFRAISDQLFKLGTPKFV